MVRPLSEVIEKTSNKRIRRYHRRTHAYLIVVIVALLLAAFFLQLLVAISMPIAKPIYLMSLKSTAEDVIPTTVATEVRFGVWGYCATSGLNNPTLFTNNGLCTAPRLGYEVSSSILALTGSNEDLVKILLKGLEVVLILHPIVAGLVLLCLTGAILSFSHLFAICALVWTIIAAILASVSTAADLAIVIFAQKEIKKVSGIFFEILWGNAPWMSLAAVALLWIVLVIQSATLCGCCGVSKRLWTRVADDEGKHYEKNMNGYSP